MFCRPTACAMTLILSLLAGVGVADDVYLTNGKVYEDVLAERTAEGVRIDLAFGQMLLSNDLVDRIERGAAPLEQYRRVKSSLESREAPAEEWLELARWAQSNDLPHGAREASLRAAEVDPGLVGLEVFMKGQSRVLDPERNRWVPEGEYLRDQGFVEVNGRWLSPAEAEVWAAAERQREVERREMMAVRAIQQAAESLERAERQAAQRREEELFLQALNASRPIVVVQPGYVVRPRQVGPPLRRPSPGSDRETPATTYRRLANRQPGSFIPVSQYSPAPAPLRSPSFDDHPSLSKGSPSSDRSSTGRSTRGESKSEKRTTRANSQRGSGRSGNGG